MRDLSAWMLAHGWAAADSQARWGTDLPLAALGFVPLASHPEGHLLCSWTWSDDEPPAIVAFGGEGEIQLAAHALEQLLAHQVEAPTDPEALPRWNDFPTPRSGILDPREAFDRAYRARVRTPGPADYIAANGWYRDLAEKGPEKQFYVHRGLLDGSIPIRWGWTFLPLSNWQGLKDSALLDRMLGGRVEDGGVVLTQVLRYSLADIAGLRSGDVVRTVDGDEDVCAAWQAAGPPHTMLAVTRGTGRLAIDFSIELVWTEPASSPIDVPLPILSKPTVRPPTGLRLVDEHGSQRPELPERICRSFGEAFFVEPLGQVWREAPARPEPSGPAETVASTEAELVAPGVWERIRGWFSKV